MSIFKETLFFISFTLVSFVTFSQAKFEKKFHFSENEFYDRGNDIIQTKDGGYLIAGRTVKFNKGGVEAYLIKLNGAGDTIWTKTYGGNGSEEAISVVESNDGGFTFCGYSNSQTNGILDVYVVHTDSKGVEQWSYTYGGKAIDRGFDIKQTKDRGYIISGETYSFGIGGVNAFLVRINDKGEKLWHKSLGGNGIQEGNAVLETSDGGFVITGATNNFGAGDDDVYLFKLSSKGEEQWVRSFGGSGSEEGRGIAQTPESGFLIVGYTNSIGQGANDVYVVKTDEKGNAIWEKNYGGEYEEQGFDVCTTDDQGYVITGVINSIGAGGTDAYLLRINKDGDIVMEKTYGSRADENGQSIIQCSDGGFAIVGSSVAASSAYKQEKAKEIFVVKTDIKGNSKSVE